MKAIVLTRYGGPETVEYKDVPEPRAPGPGEMLVDVHAASVNPVDFKIRDGELKVLLAIKPPIVMGNDLAGVVQAVGAGVTRFKKGDRVFARVEKNSLGAFAERALVRERDAALVPAGLGLHEAASIPLVGLTAWQALVDLAGVQPGQRVLVHAGAGGLGSIAIQLAKHLGAFVATTASKPDLVLSLGVDQVVNYRMEDFSKTLKGFDMVLDTLGKETQMKSFGVLKPGGVLVDVAGTPDVAFGKEYGLNPIVRLALWFMGRKRSALVKRLGVRYRFLFMLPSGEQLAKLGELISAGKLKPVVDKVFPLEKGREALAYVESGKAHGKVVLAVKPAGAA